MSKTVVKMVELNHEGLDKEKEKIKVVIQKLEEVKSLVEEITSLEIEIALEIKFKL